mgnify:CR=1 FL=1
MKKNAISMAMMSGSEDEADGLLCCSVCRSYVVALWLLVESMRRSAEADSADCSLWAAILTPTARSRTFSTVSPKGRAVEIVRVSNRSSMSCDERAAALTIRKDWATAIESASSAPCSAAVFDVRHDAHSAAIIRMNIVLLIGIFVAAVQGIFINFASLIFVIRQCPL